MKLSQIDMMAATKLTKSGKLLEATALIQKMLNGNQSARTVSTPDATEILPEKLATQAPLHAPKVKRKTAGPVGKFETKNYADSNGQRNYKLFTPGSYEGQPLPLVVMLHGCSQSPNDFAAGTDMNALAEEMGFFVAYPEQPTSANAMGCWNWFKPSDQKKENGEPALIAGIVGRIVAEQTVDNQMIYVAGLSAGGAMAAILGMTYPDLFAAIGVHSGLPCGAASSTVGAFNAMKNGATMLRKNKSRRPVPTIVFHGDRDRTVAPGNSDDVIAQFDSQATFGRSVNETGVSNGGMKYSRSVIYTDNGAPMFEQWTVHGAGHAWSGGSAKGSYTEPRGPGASQEMVRFFFEHKLVTV